MQKNNFQKDLTNAIYCVILCIVDKTKTDIWRNKNEVKEVYGVFV